MTSSRTRKAHVFLIALAIFVRMARLGEYIQVVCSTKMIREAHRSPLAVSKEHFLLGTPPLFFLQELRSPEY